VHGTNAITKGYIEARNRVML